MKIEVQNWTGENWVTVAQFAFLHDAEFFVSAASDTFSHYRIKPTEE